MKKFILFIALSVVYSFSIGQNVQLDLKVYLEGPYFNGQMTPFLNVLGEIPLDQPYDTIPWNYEGSESVTVLPTYDIVDWILIDILIPLPGTDTATFEIYKRKVGFILKDGQVRSMDGSTNLEFDIGILNQAYIRIHHRNHLSIISASPVTISNNTLQYDFTTGPEKSMGGEHTQKQLATSLWGMIASDGDANGQIDNKDKNDVWLQQDGLTGYYSGDFNLDTQVDEDDIIANWILNAGYGSVKIKDTISKSFECGDSLWDIRDGKRYATVLIDDQCWMAQNLNYGVMVDGSMDQSDDQVAEKYCYNNTEDSCGVYGALYQWDELMNYSTTEKAEGICPEGWYIPSDDDWKKLEGISDSQYDVGDPIWDNSGYRGFDVAKNLKSTHGWMVPGNGVDLFDMSVLPGGSRDLGGNFSYYQTNSPLWTSTEASGTNAVYREFFFFYDNLYRSNLSKDYGYSVRCIRDIQTPNNPPNAPHSPLPSDGSVEISSDTTLHWSCSDPDQDILSYNVYFGKTINPALVDVNIADTSYIPGKLFCDSTYFWRIVAYDNQGDSTEGPLWSFTTRSFICGDIFIDTRDSNQYNTVQIGSQCWMAENLNYGIMIDSNIHQHDNGIIEKYCYRDNEENCSEYGGLYLYHEALDHNIYNPQGLCPDGWHIPNDNNWDILINNHGGYSLAGGKLKEIGFEHWNEPNTGASNENGFSALPAGSRTYYYEHFNGLGQNTYFWSSFNKGNISYVYGLYYNSSSVNKLTYGGGDPYGYSVRCVRDADYTPWSCGDSIIDYRDNQKYATVEIDSMCWMAQNLNYGSTINGNEEMTDNGIIEKYCYENEEDSCTVFGGLYQWDEIMNYDTIESSKGICPDGWHIPSDEEWKRLEGAADSQFNYPDPEWDNLMWRGFDAGKHLKHAQSWINNGGGLDSYGFGAKAGGYRFGSTGFGGFSATGFSGNYWSSTKTPTDTVWSRVFNYGYDQSYRATYDFEYAGYSLRCIKDTPIAEWQCGDSIIDSRDSQKYGTVQVGEQCWMSQNLNTGTRIDGSNEMIDNSIVEKYCYNDSEDTCSVYGGLYQWNEMMNYSNYNGAQGICPDGWYIPTDTDWKILEANSDSQYPPGSNEWDLFNEWRGNDVGGNLKETGIDHWLLPNEGATNSTGFTSLPAGDRFANGTFNNIFNYSFYWSSTQNNTYDAFNRALKHDSITIHRNAPNKNFGMSIRCIKEPEPINWSCGDSLTDQRDSKKYGTVQIGKQCWMSENLNVGIQISSDHVMSDNGVLEKFCYDDDENNCNSYGGLYQWNELMQYDTTEIKGVCPDGWHIPTDNQWKILEGNADSQYPVGDPIWDNSGERGYDAGYNLKDDIQWNGSNQYGFSGLHGGAYVWDGYVGDDGEGVWWTSTFNNNSKMVRFIDGSDKITRFAVPEGYAHSVRCIKDTVVIQNTAPQAHFLIEPDTGTIDTTFIFDASVSFDNEQSLEELHVRWDWENDGTWDTDWTNQKTHTHQYAQTGVYPVKLQVRDTKYLVDSIVDTVYVFQSLDCPDFFTDIRDNRQYRAVKIGGQCWMAENLNIGTMINSSNDMLDNGIIEKYCYNDTEDSCNTYGGLYQWNELLNYAFSAVPPPPYDSIYRGICPIGWHVPTDDEWKILEGYVDNQYPIGDLLWDQMDWRGFDVGLQLKSDSTWQNGGYGTNNFGFNILPGGYINHSGGYFIFVGEEAKFWSSIHDAPSSRYIRRFVYDQSGSYRMYQDINSGLSVRCIKDKENNAPGQPSGPSPSSGSTGMTIDTSLSWSCSDPDGEYLRYDVYLGYSSNLYLLAEDLADTFYLPNLKFYDTTYYWKVVAKDIYGKTTESDIWSFTTKSFECGDLLSDSRDSQKYNTVVIGDQCWMAENLNIGTMTFGIDDQIDDGIIEKYCYNNSQDSCDVYGGLYQWDEMMEYETIEGSQGICPNGWHIPTDEEWKQLEGTVDSQYGYPDPEWDNTSWRGFDAGLNLKSNYGWEGYPFSNGVDIFNFTALPAGFRISYGVLDGLNISGHFWTSSISSANGRWERKLHSANGDISRRDNNKFDGFSVRCIKNISPQSWSCGDTLTDTRDNQKYSTVQIGDQCWMAENLNIGSMLNSSNDMLDNGIIEKYCYNDIEGDCDVYGGLYQWDEMMNYSSDEGSQGLCPDGWHVPSDFEWCSLTNELDPSVNCGIFGWTGTNVGYLLKNDDFNSLLSGYWEEPYMQFVAGQFETRYWTSSQATIDNSWMRQLRDSNNNIYRGHWEKLDGYSVRCIKD